MTTESELDKQKAGLRQQAKLARTQLADRASRSDQVMRRAMALPEYGAARCVLWYVDTGTEVQTRVTMAQCLKGPSDIHRRVAVPYCARDELQLVWIQSLDELAPGRFGIQEPCVAVRQAVERQVTASDLDLVLVPGVAFDRRGGRLGYGRGFYDRLLARIRPDATRVGLAFDCQVFDAIPQQPHDQRLDRVVTESTVYRCRSQPAA